MATYQPNRNQATYGQPAPPRPASNYGNDPRGNVQNTIDTQTQRYNQQQGPLANAMANNYGRFSESDYGNYTDIMNQYRDIASNSGGSGGGSGGGGGGGGGGYNAYTVNPERVGAERASVRALGPLERVKASDPFESYKGYQEFGQTGGYSSQDIANMRARGVAPIRAAYANAERNVSQGRALQGGYSPNAAAAQVKMAREQGQSMADASQNVDAQIAQARNAGRLAGYGGMAGIEGQRLNAQMQGDIFNAGQANEGQKFDIGNEMGVSQFNAGQGNQVGMFNADLNYKGQTYNADAQTQAEARNIAAAQQAAASRAAGAAQDQQNRLAALRGMSSLYGTTPGASQMFGNQVSDIVGQGGNFGTNMVNAQIRGQGLPGQWDQTMGRANDVMDLVNAGSTYGSAFLKNRSPQQQQTQKQPNYGYQQPVDYGYGGGGYNGNVDPWGNEDENYIPY